MGQREIISLLVTVYFQNLCEPVLTPERVLKDWCLPVLIASKILRPKSFKEPRPGVPI